MSVQTDIIELLTDYVDTPAAEIDTTVGLKYLGLNSYVTLSLITAIEDKFGISIPDEQLTKFETLDDIIKYIESVVK